jgi:PPM family protein phosphatase
MMEIAMEYRGVGHSSLGRKRDNNEDAFVADDELGLYVVSDGMGGHAAGEIASLITIRTVCEIIKTRSAEMGEASMDRASTVALVTDAVQHACDVVYRAAKADPERAGMGCTVTLAWIRDGFATLAHVGDTRCYLRRGDEISQLTSDHTVEAELRRAGLEEERQLAPRFARSLTRAVGTQSSVQVDAFNIDLLNDDLLLLCSDGLTEYIPSAEWLGAELQGSALDAVAEELIEHANAEGGKDNITVALVHVQSANHAAAPRHSIEISGRLQALSSVFLFEPLSAGLLGRVLNHCEVGRYDDGEVLIDAGDALGRLVVVVEGRVVVDGEAPLGPGTALGITALLEPREARATVVADGPVTVVALSKEGFWRLAKRRPWLGVNLLEHLDTELGEALDASVSRRDDGIDATTPLLANERV